MMKYNEPEFKVVKVKSQDVISTSGELPGASNEWQIGDTGSPIITT